MENYSVFQPNHLLSVSQLTGYLREVLETDAVLQDLWVQGEISNLARPSSGHLYFTLKDSQAAIRCVMWRSTAARLKFDPQEGLAVEAHGGMGIYEVSGQVQFYVDTMKPAGEGALYQQFLRLKAALEAEGLFDPDRKRPVPKRPHTIGIVTSPTGAALQDMLNTLRRRYPLARVVLSPTPVQGVEAPPGIIAALQQLNSRAAPDVILIGRGGGSIEDLWAFNDEAVVRAVAASEAPVVSGVGHETDFTLTDFAADLRAPTPTAAAEMSTPDRLELQGIVLELSGRLTTRLKETLADRRWETRQQIHQLHLHSPKHRIDTFRQRLDETSARLHREMRTKLEKDCMQLENLQNALRSLNPQAVLNRGYAIVTHQDSRQVIKNAAAVAPEEKIRIRLSRGEMTARITETKPGDSS
jgi:exodeoxyribonuclease VII large subunit